MSDYSIIPAPQTYGSGYAWWGEENIPRGKEGGLSVGGWTSGNEGFMQQTFLGASITSFTVNAGFGDTSSTLSVELVNDEYNISDLTGLGSGDDVYHDTASGDIFSPPVVGSPVYFKFGKNHATIDQAYRLSYDQLYGFDTFSGIVGEEIYTVNPNQISGIQKDQQYFSHVGLVETESSDGETQTAPTATMIDRSFVLDPENNLRGSGHFTFGGILQSYTQNKSAQGNPLYSVQVVDPREILANTSLILNNYQGTTFNNKNLMNIYGFLEYDPSDDLSLNFFNVKIDSSGEPSVSGENLFKKDILSKSVNESGIVSYSGLDVYGLDSGIFSSGPFTKFFSSGDIEIFTFVEQETNSGIPIMSGDFPVTGQGFSRRGERGIPFYRVTQAMDVLFEKQTVLPEEYKNSGFGGPIDFRGYKYVVDFSGLPLDKISTMYFLDFDQMTLLDLALEVSEILSHEIFVTLLPIIDHPACKFIFEKNKYYIQNGKPTR